MTLTVRRLVSSDLPELLRVYSTQSKLIKVEKTATIEQHYAKLFPAFLEDNNPNAIAFGVFNSERLLSFSTASKWASTPCWSLGLFYTDKSFTSTVINLDVTLVLLTALATYFEKIQVYSCYIVATLNATLARQWQSINIASYYDNVVNDLSGNARYITSIEEIIPPFSYSKHITFSNMIGILEGLNPEPLVIRQWSLAPNYRVHNISDKYMKRLRRASA